MTNNFVFETDMAAKTIRISREFNAPVDKVWRAWTEPELIEKWIAPKPWRAETRTWDFTVGGVWLYAMVGTEGQRFWVYAEFTGIDNKKAISTTGKFCDGEGNPVTSGPQTYKDAKFSALGGGRSKVDQVIVFDDESTIKMFAEGGFKQGTEASLANLDELLGAM